jgi:hypothetical protein
VKRTKPRTFGLKYFGSCACAAPTMKPVLTAEQGNTALQKAIPMLKGAKERKVSVTVSTVGIRIVDTHTGEYETVENEPLIQIAFCTAVPGDKKKVAYITSYSKLGLVYCHVFACAKSAEADAFVAAIAERKRTASVTRSMVPPTGTYSAFGGPCCRPSFLFLFYRCFSNLSTVKLFFFKTGSNFFFAYLFLI